MAVPAEQLLVFSGQVWMLPSIIFSLPTVEYFHAAFIVLSSWLLVCFKSASVKVECGWWSPFSVLQVLGKMTSQAVRLHLHSRLTSHFPKRGLCEFAPSVLSDWVISALESDSILSSDSSMEKVPWAKLKEQFVAFILIYLALSLSEAFFFLPPLNTFLLSCL